jgi:hypothetical protein
MIIKSMSRKRPDCGELLTYLLQPEKTRPDEHVSLKPLFHNFPAELPVTSSSIEHAFETNARLVPRRKNGVFYYHEILSFAPADTEHLAANPAILSDLAETYLTRRAPEALALGVIHHDRDHLHIHLLISANAIGQVKKLRLAKQAFQAVKRDLEAYQRMTYPQLSHSIAQSRQHANPLSPARSSSKTTILGKPPPKPTKNATKTHLQAVLRQAFTCCSHHDFPVFLQAHHITLYTRKHSKAPTGLVYQGKKYRFATLGLKDEFQKTITGWQRLPGFLDAFKNHQAETLRQQWRRETGYHHEIAEVLEPANTPLTAMMGEQQKRRRMEYLQTKDRSGRDAPER